MSGTCMSCNLSKNTVNYVGSKLLNGVNVRMCGKCANAGFEPRWVIVLAGRSNGAAYVGEYVTKHLYVGDKILAEEIMVSR